MKALIICSVHVLFDISGLERVACNRACALHAIPAILTTQDHRHLLSSATMLDLLNHLPGSPQQRRSLIESYLDLLNEEIWNASMRAYESVRGAVLDAYGKGWATAVVSDYPMLTTNLLRSAALLTNATKSGQLIAPHDPMDLRSIPSSLDAAASSLGVAHKDVEVIVALQRDYLAAQSLGMHPRFAEDAPANAHAGRTSRRPLGTIHRARAPKHADTTPLPEHVLTIPNALADHLFP